MTNIQMNLRPLRLGTTGLLVCVVLLVANHGKAQERTNGNNQRRPTQGPDDNRDVPSTDSLEKRLQRLQDKVAQLEAALEQPTGKSAAGSSMSGSGMSERKMKGMKMQGMGMMKGRKNSSQDKGGQKSDGMKMGMGMGMMGGGGMKMGMGMGMMGGGGMKMGMGMMGRMKGMGSKSTGPMEVTSSLPGFPGASHIYHVGATGFFLNHAEHITLTPEQRRQLNQIKEAALLAQSTFDRRIEEAEQQLWVLTAADRPDATAIEARVGEIAKLAAEKRIAFIRAVGRATEILTDDQRQTLIGLLPPEHTAADSTTTTQDATK